MSAEVQESAKKKGKGSKQKKMSVRVDFTPMVDMNMLLITLLHALYLAEQASDDGDKHAKQR